MRIRMNFEASEDPGIDFRKVNKKTGEMEFVPGKTKQADAPACDINNILKRYEENGVLPDMIRANPQYGDFSNVPSYQEALETVMKAEEQFGALPAKIRERFNNNPASMLEFVNDPENGAEMIKLGMRIPKEKTEPEMGGKNGIAVPKESTTATTKPS